MVAVICLVFSLLFYPCLAYYGQSTSTILWGYSQTINCVVSDGTFAYFGANMSVIKFDLAKMSINQTLAVSDPLSSVILYNNYLYFGTYTSPGKIHRLSLELSNLTTVTLTTGQDYLTTAVADGGIGYFGTFTNSGIVVKLSLDNATYLGYLNSGKYHASSVITSPGVAAFGSDTTSTLVTQVNLTSGIQIGTYTFTLPTRMIGGFVYNNSVCFASRVSTNTGFYKLPLSGLTPAFTATTLLSGNVTFFTRKDNIGHVVLDSSEICPYYFDTNLFSTPCISLPTSTANVPCGVLVNGYLYLGSNEASSVIYRVDLHRPCSTKFGTISHNQNLTVYSTNSTCGFCSDLKGIITCNDGNLTGNIDYNYTNCIEPCTCKFAAKDSQNPVVILHGANLTVYYQNYTCGGQCVQGSIYCNNTVMTGDIGFNYTSCSAVNTCPCSITIGGQAMNIPHLGKLTVYSQGSQCSSCLSVQGSVYCNNTVVYGDLSYGYSTCTPLLDCACNYSISNTWVTIPHNSNYSVYSTNSPCGSCSSVQGLVYCNNTFVSGDLSYVYDSCASLSNCSCTDAIGDTLLHGYNRTVYSTSVACDCSKYIGIITCENGNLTGKVDFTYSDCSGCGTPLLQPLNATLNVTSSNTVITMYFPESLNTSVTYGIANKSNGKYVRNFL